jgi:hypothetical protein
MDSNGKFLQIWDTFMLIVIAYSCFTSAYFISFSFADGPELNLLEHVVFVSYTLDIMFNFMRLPVCEGDSN